MSVRFARQLPRKTGAPAPSWRATTIAALAAIALPLSLVSVPTRPALALADPPPGGEREIPGGEREIPGGEREIHEATRAEVDRYVAAFRSVSETAKKDAMRRLIDLGPNTVPYLLEGFPHVPEEAATWLVRVFGQLGERRASAALAERYPDASAPLREEIVVALGALGDPGCVPVLSIALCGGSSALRHRAAAALGQVGTAQAAEALVHALSDEDPWVRTEVVASLQTGALGAAQSTRFAGVDLVARVHELLPRLRGEAKDDAVRLLASLRDPRSLPTLIDYLRLGTPVARRLSARALAAIGASVASDRPSDTDAGRALLLALDDEDEQVRLEVVRSLTVLEGIDCFEPLAERLDIEESPRVVLAIRRALRGFAGRDLGRASEPWLVWLDTRS